MWRTTVLFFMPGNRVAGHALTKRGHRQQDERSGAEALALARLAPERNNVRGQACKAQDCPHRYSGKGEVVVYPACIKCDLLKL